MVAFNQKFTKCTFPSPQEIKDSLREEALDSLRAVARKEIKRAVKAGRTATETFRFDFSYDFLSPVTPDVVEAVRQELLASGYLPTVDGRLMTISFSADAHRKARRYPSMNIYAPPGSKVRFTRPTAGYYSDQKTAAEHLLPGGVYTVRRTAVGSYHTLVYLEEVPGVSFNSVMFEDFES